MDVPANGVDLQQLSELQQMLDRTAAVFVGGAAVGIACAHAWRRLREARRAPQFDVCLAAERARPEYFTVKHALAEAIFGPSANGALALWVADMDLPCCERIRRALARRCDHPTFGYTFMPSAAWALVARWLREQQACIHTHTSHAHLLTSHLLTPHHTIQAWTLPLDSSSFVFSPSVVTSFANLVRAFTAAGDRVLCFTPLYGPMQVTPTLAQTRTQSPTLTLTGCPTTRRRAPSRGAAGGSSACPSGWTTQACTEWTCPLSRRRRRSPLPDFCSGGHPAPHLAHSRPVHLPLGALLTWCAMCGYRCNPHNPSGRAWTAAEQAAVAAVCARHGLLAVSDEVHADWTLWGRAHAPFATEAAAAKCDCITLPMSPRISPVSPRHLPYISGATASRSTFPHLPTPSHAFSHLLRCDCITLNAPTKTWNLAGVHCSYLVFAGERHSVYHDAREATSRPHISPISRQATAAPGSNGPTLTRCTTRT